MSLTNAKMFRMLIEIPNIDIQVPEFEVRIEEIQLNHAEEQMTDSIEIPCNFCNNFINLEIRINPKPKQLPHSVKNTVVVVKRNNPFVVEMFEVKEDLETPALDRDFQSTSAECLDEETLTYDLPTELNLCTHCGLTFPNATELSRHFSSSHRIVSHKQCPICGVQILYNLKRHIQYQHGPNRYFCDLCPKVFKRKENIADHMRRVHIEPEELLACPQCPKMFRHRENLKKHFDAMHGGKEKQRRHACSLCSSVFLTPSLLATHMDGHNRIFRFRCEVCDKLFLRKRNLDAHMITHNPELKFSCRYCGKGFARKKGKEVHERIHTGERNYDCTYPDCEARFYEEGTLRQHKLAHVKRDKNLGNMRLPEVAKRYHRNGKFYWEEGYPSSDKEEDEQTLSTIEQEIDF